MKKMICLQLLISILLALSLPARAVGNCSQAVTISISVMLAPRNQVKSQGVNCPVRLPQQNTAQECSSDGSDTPISIDSLNAVRDYPQIDLSVLKVVAANSQARPTGKR